MNHISESLPHPSLSILDIGSNSVRFAYMAQQPSGRFCVPDKQKLVCTTQLGKGLDATGLLSSDSMHKTVSACERFYAMAQEQQVPIYAYATSAVRDAGNRQALIEDIKRVCPKMQLFILSGQEEGSLAYLGAFQGESGTLIDIGGGSMQVVSPTSAQSYPTGCVRARDWCPERPLPQMRDTLYAWLRSRVTLPQDTCAPYLGVGGTITTLGALLLQQTKYDGSELSTLRLTPELLSTLLTKLYQMGDEERARNPLLSRRHDIILQGGLILLWLMEQLSIKWLTPTDHDGMEGFAAWLLQKGIL